MYNTNSVPMPYNIGHEMSRRNNVSQKMIKKENY